MKRKLYTTGIILAFLVTFSLIGRILGTPIMLWSMTLVVLAVVGYQIGKRMLANLITYLCSGS
jgi:hypothetical protein